jgi:TANFOR domain-containing protein
MKKIFCLLAAIVMALHLRAQVYPVQVTPQLLPPYSLHVSDYFSNAGSPKLNLLVLLKDLSKSDIQLRFRMVIESQSLRIRTREDVVFLPITLQTGIPYYVQPSELAQYFNANNLEFSGITRSQYEQTGKLPEGFYTFCFEAVEVTTGKAVSNKGCALGWMTLSDPPFLTLPAKAESITPRNPQNVLFQWTPRHMASPGNAYVTDYIFSITELTDTVISPQAAFAAGPPLYTDTTNATVYLYNVTKPPLIAGKKYAWRVQAKNKQGAEDLGMFRNNGYSEVWWFTYLNTCPTPLGITATVQGQRVTIEWQADPQHLDYKVQYRETNNADAEWFTLSNTQPRVMLYDLRPGTQYEYRVGSACEFGVFNYSNMLSFTTPAANVPTMPDCGIDPNIPTPEVTLLQTLAAGDTVRAGDFTIHLTQATGTGSFSGQGYVKVSWLANMKIAVRFNNITVNTDKKLVSGFIETTYDPTEGGIASIDAFIEGGVAYGSIKNGLDTADYNISFPVAGPQSFTVSPGTGYDSVTGKG